MMKPDHEIVDDLFAALDRSSSTPKPSSALLDQLNRDAENAARGFLDEMTGLKPYHVTNSKKQTPANWMASIMGIAAAAVFGFWLGFSDFSTDFTSGLGIGANSSALETIFEGYETRLGEGS